MKIDINISNIIRIKKRRKSDEKKIIYICLESNHSPYDLLIQHNPSIVRVSDTIWPASGEGGGEGGA